jgi:hypothetical protein
MDSVLGQFNPVGILMSGFFKPVFLYCACRSEQLTAIRPSTLIELRISYTTSSPPLLRNVAALPYFSVSVKRPSLYSKPQGLNS